jgi:hypothetical protein
MKHGSFSWQASKSDVRTAVGTFLLGGPALLAPIWIVTTWRIGDTPGSKFGELIAIPLLAPVGFLSWWSWALQPRMALLTWIPTLSAGVTSGYSLHLLAECSWYQQVPRILKFAVAGVVCAIISALIYETTWRISGYLGAVPPVSQSTRFFARDGGVPIVAAIGFVLGTYLAWRVAKRIPPIPSSTV